MQTGTKGVHGLDEVKPTNLAMDPGMIVWETCWQVLVSENGQVRQCSLNVDQQSSLRALYGQEKSQKPSATTTFHSSR